MPVKVLEVDELAAAVMAAVKVIGVSAVSVEGRAVVVSRTRTG